MIKEKDAFEKSCNKIDSIKQELMSLVYELEEDGYKRKAKSLETIVARLEAWEHTGK